MGPDVARAPLADLLAERLERIEARLAALETADTPDDDGRADDLAKVAWAVQHGRKRPW